MGQRVTIQAGDDRFEAELRDTPCAQAIAAALPFSGRAQIWGDEIYFSVAVEAALEADASEVVAVGTLAFWPPGKALCLFFGPTPASQADECRAASAVNIVGHINGDLAGLRQVQQGTQVTVSAAP